MAGRDEARRQHGMIKIRLAISALARLALRAAEFFASKNIRSVEGDQRPPAEPLECLHTAAPAHDRHGLIERTLQMRGMHKIQQ